MRLTMLCAALLMASLCVHHDGRAAIRHGRHQPGRGGRRIACRRPRVCRGGGDQADDRRDRRDARRRCGDAVAQVRLFAGQGCDRGGAARRPRQVDRDRRAGRRCGRASPPTASTASPTASSPSPRTGKPDGTPNISLTGSRADGGWRVALFKRGRSAAGRGRDRTDGAASCRAGSSPRTRHAMAAHKASLVAAEQAFSDRAQVDRDRAGVRRKSARPTRRTWARAPTSPSAMQEIGAAVGDGDAADPNANPLGAGRGRAGSVKRRLGRDLGLGSAARLKDGKPAQQFPFITMWRRADPQSPWRYIAE